MRTVLLGKTFIERIINANVMGKQTEKQQVIRGPDESSSHRKDGDASLCVSEKALCFYNTSM